MNNCLGILKKIAVYFQKKNDSLFSFPVSKQKAFLEALDEPVDDVERSYFQYLCQIKMNGVITNALWQFASLFLFFALWVKYSNNEKTAKVTETECNTVFVADGLETNIIPNVLRDELGEIKIAESQGNLHITEEDKIFIRKISKRYPKEWYFKLKLLIKIAQYRKLIQVYHPTKILVCSEYSFTSSVLNEYCARKEIELINIQHGENFYFMMDAFFHFSRCYVWSEHYKKLFQELRAEESQFIIAKPEALRFKSKYDEEDKIYDYIYYLGAENKSQLKSILSVLEKMKQQGLKIAVRPHPRYSNFKLVSAIFSDFAIEKPSECGIEKSLMHTKNVISLHSAVLRQAHENSIPIIIDDVSNLKVYEKLKELKYDLLEDNQGKLSELV